MSREYPDYPRVGVGAVILHDDKVLLVRRGKAPSFGKWSLPGGLVDRHVGGAVGGLGHEQPPGPATLAVGSSIAS